MKLNFKNKLYLYSSSMVILVTGLASLEIIAYQNISSGKISLSDFLFLTFSIVIVLTILIVHSVNYFSIPITDLRMATKNMSEGNFTEVFEINSSDKSNLISEMIQNLQVTVKLQVQSLNKKIEEKKAVESELNMYRNTLEEQVKERTKNLHKANDDLRHEIQKREQAEIEKEIMQQQAFQSSKFASLGEMAGGIAHEVNNPLAIIKGKSQQLRIKNERGTLTGDSIELGLDKIDKTVDRIIKIIRGLRTLSRDSSGDPFEKASISQIIEESLSICTEKFKNEGIDIRVKHKHLEAETECRPTQISQVIINLLNNAHDAIVESCSSSEKEQRWVLIESEDLSNEIYIAVSNGGPPIPEEIKDKILLPFFTTKDVGKGTGLGLSISTSIVEDHQGRIRVDTSEGYTKFIIHLKKNLAQEQKEKKSA